MHHIIVQYATDKTLSPKASLLRKWASHALTGSLASAEVTIRIVDTAEMTELNTRYRKKSGPTNVLSFTFDMPEGVEVGTPILGDIVICADVVNREAEEQGITTESHWAHMVVHGIFHLLGYDHENDQDASVMEKLEIQKLQALGFANPYDHGDSIKTYE